jgi:hypothetical protein
MAVNKKRYQEIINKLIDYFETLVDMDDLRQHWNDGKTPYDNNPDNYNWMLAANIPEILNDLLDIRDANHYHSEWVSALFEKMKRPGVMFLC